MSTILAVDDSATMRKCLEITFEGTEFNLVTCDSASAALEQVKSLSPDLVIADVSLPPGDGYELCSTIKLASPGTPVLMLSSKQNPFDPAKGAQADDHIDKPFDTQVLQDRARQLINAAPKSDTDIPGRPAAQKPVAMPAATASSRIPAPRRKHPTPAMMQSPVSPAAKAAQAAGRRTVPFAMPSAMKKTAPGGIQAEVAKARATGAARDTHDLTSGSPTPVEGDGAGLPPATPTAAIPQPTSPPAVAPRTAAATQPAGPAADGAAGVALPAELGGKLAALGLTKDQIEGVLALSREVVEQVVWEVVPTLAETMIQEEIRRLTKD